MLIGSAATRALVEGEDGRYMRALKSVLGTTLFHEARLIGGRRRTLAEIVAGFLAEVRVRAEAATGARYRRALSGRPVHFHSDDLERDGRAEEDLRACYLAAGFEEVDFVFEPEAAARASVGLGRAGETGLIVDIGGGTSDFSVFRAERGRVGIIASHGIRLGGTDFDQALSLAEAMPMLGMGSELERSLGVGRLPVPNAIFVELATWAKIPFVYGRDSERLTEDLRRHAVEPEKLHRLERVIRDHLGHDLAFAVEAGKIGVQEVGGAGIDLGAVEPGLVRALGPEALATALAAHRRRLGGAIRETLAAAGVAQDGIDNVVLVGGSSLMALVADEAMAACPTARLSRAQAFTAVVDGLALASGG
jgi:hypothetical chaperone protein